MPRILTGLRVEGQQNLARVNGFADSVKLFHQRLVDVQTTRRIENHHVALMRTGVFDGFLRGLDRILRSMLVNRNADLTADNL